MSRAVRTGHIVGGPPLMPDVRGHVTREEFDAQYKSRPMRLSLQGLPPSENLFYVCECCGDVIPSTLAVTESCSCGNIFVDIKNCGVAIEMRNRVSALEVLK